MFLLWSYLVPAGTTAYVVDSMICERPSATLVVHLNLLEVTEPNILAAAPMCMKPGLSAL